jgi:hypothetical protein
MTLRCREGHVSEEPDYCSVCGVSIVAPPRAAAAAGPSPPLSTPLPSSVRAALPSACPACGEPRAEPDARFCEVCRYDFVSRKAGPPPIGARPPTPSAAPPASAAPPPLGANPPAFEKWVIAVAIDPSLDTEPDPESPCPKDAPTAAFAIDRTEMLIGRHDDRRDIHPDLPVHDPGASRRHAKLVLSADGTLELLDLASTNGTSLNGVQLGAGARAGLKAGDEITFGRWTRITVRAKTRGAL